MAVSPGYSALHVRARGIDRVLAAAGNARGRVRSAQRVSGADFELVQRVLAGREDAVAALVRRLACVARILAVRNARLAVPLPTGDLPDVVQDVVAKVWERLPEYRAEASLESWVFRFCEFGLMNAVRRHRRSRPGLDDAALVDEHGDRPHAVDLARVFESLDRLPADQAQVVRARHFDGSTFEAIAAARGEPLSTVKSRYYRAIDQLRRSLAPAFAEDDQ